MLLGKPATTDMENRKGVILTGVILQAHMNIVPQKTPDNDHNFLTDPIEASVDGDWV
ncbi:MAG: hypothetical protein WBB55_08885 [Anaerolineales bacterium]